VTAGDAVLAVALRTLAVSLASREDDVRLMAEA
jgi:hypothetical protein